MARGGREGAAQKDEEVELKSPGATMCSMAMGAYALECTSVRYLDDYFKKKISFFTPLAACFGAPDCASCPDRQD